MKTYLLASIIMVAASSAAIAADWPQQAIDKAIAQIDPDGADGDECFRNAGTKAVYDVAQIDLNGDGINELKISRSSDKPTGCYGMVGQDVYLMIADGQGDWKKQFGFDSTDLVAQSEKNEGWPDIEITGRGFCFPIYRYYNGEYGIWKTCQGPTQIFADGDPEITRGAVPRDAGKASVVPVVATEGGVPFHAPEFLHNDSFVTVDHRVGEIRYVRPKKSIAGTVKPGALLFKGNPWDQYDQNGRITGTAYAFKKGCPPAPYEVSGGFSPDWSRIVLHGAAPVRKKQGCDVVSYSTESPNGTLIFEALAD